MTSDIFCELQHREIPDFGDTKLVLFVIFSKKYLSALPTFDC